jgi:hypothetical protein
MKKQEIKNQLELIIEGRRKMMSLTEFVGRENHTKAINVLDELIKKLQESL